MSSSQVLYSNRATRNAIPLMESLPIKGYPSGKVETTEAAGNRCC
jgi:hypothetical protein